MNRHRLLQGDLLQEQNPAYGLLRPISILITIRSGEGRIAKSLAITGKADTCTGDLRQWQQGVAVIRQLVDAMPSSLAATVKSEICDLMAVRAAMHAMVEAANGVAACAMCGGMCCRCGKYHFSAIDL